MLTGTVGDCKNDIIYEYVRFYRRIELRGGALFPPTWLSQNCDVLVCGVR